MKLGDLGISYTTGDDGKLHLTLPEEARTRVLTFIRETSVKPPGEIATAVQDGHDLILRNIEGLSDEQARYKPSPENWSVLEAMGHVVTVKRIVPVLCAALGAGELPPGFGPQFEEERAQDGVSAANFSTISEAREAAETAHRDMLAVITEIGGADTKLRFKHFVFGAMNAREWACFSRVHDADHGPHLLKIRNSPGFPL